MSDRPGYADIAAHYRAQIQDGTLAPGDAMPSLKDVCEQFGCALTTANRAFRVLKSEGLTRSEAGVGTFVAHRRDVAVSGVARLKRLQRTGRHYAHRETVTEQRTRVTSCADPDLVELLEIEPHDEIILRTRVFREDDRPTVVAISCIHMRALLAVPELVEGRPLPKFWQTLYTERTGEEITRSPEQRRARQASQEELDALQIEAPEDIPVPVLELQTVFHTEEGPIEVWQDVYAPGVWQVDPE